MGFPLTTALPPCHSPPQFHLILAESTVQLSSRFKQIRQKLSPEQYALSKDGLQDMGLILDDGLRASLSPALGPVTAPFYLVEKPVVGDGGLLRTREQ